MAKGAIAKEEITNKILEVLDDKKDALTLIEKDNTISTENFKAESFADLLFIIIKTPNKTHHSKVIEISANEVSFAIGSIAIIPVYTPAIIANIINRFQDKSISPNNFFNLFIV